MLCFGPFEKSRAQVAVAQIRALCDDGPESVSVRIHVDEARLSENDRLLWRASKGETPSDPPRGGVDEALAFLNWFQLGETLAIFEVQVEGASPDLCARITALLNG